MINGINGIGTINWYQILNSTQKKTASGTNPTGEVDSADLSQAAFGPAGPGQRQDPLETLVNDGTITQDQADSVKSALQAGRPGQGEGGQDFMSGVLDGLVKDGTITQDQEDSVKQAMVQGHRHHHHHVSSAQAAQTASGSPDSGSTAASATATAGSGTHASVLDSLVSSGVITQDQEDAIRSAFQQAADTRRAMSAYSAGGTQNTGLSI